jgi:hypothetical protein
MKFVDCIWLAPELLSVRIYWLCFVGPPFVALARQEWRFLSGGVIDPVVYLN